MRWGVTPKMMTLVPYPHRVTSSEGQNPTHRISFLVACGTDLSVLGLRRQGCGAAPAAPTLRD